MAIDEARKKEYDAYINSPAWKRFREGAIIRANYCCQRCGISKWSVTLEAHHLTYERFKRERAEDVIVLCPKCHEVADADRRKVVQAKNEAALEDARFEGWAQKVYVGENGWGDWRDFVDEETAQEKYSDWCERRGD